MALSATFHGSGGSKACVSRLPSEPRANPLAPALLYHGHSSFLPPTAAFPTLCTACAAVQCLRAQTMTVEPARKGQKQQRCE